MRPPIVGEVVHFRIAGRCYAATVVHVWSPTTVSLFVPPTGAEEPVSGALSAERVASSVPFNDKIHGSDWSWHYAG